MVTPSSGLIWQIISFILSLNEYGCAYAWTMLGKWDCDRLTEDDTFDKKRAHIEQPTHTKRVTVWCGFWTRYIIELMFDTVGQLFVGVIKDKCYADKPETIGTLKDHISEAHW